MKLARIHAYQLSPRRTATAVIPVVGGHFPVTKAIRDSLADLFVKSGLAKQAQVDFRVPDGGTIASHAVRKLLLDFSFGGGTSASTASLKLSERLADSMDNRSPAALLVLTCLEDGNKRRTILWAFPQESGFQFRSNSSGSNIRVLKDIFSHSSRLRKAALFEGPNTTAGFLSGRIIDLQAYGSTGTGADYWIDQFLDCEFSLSGVAGTRRLANYLRAAHEALRVQDDKEQVFAAIMAIRTSPTTNWSYNRVAKQFLKEPARSEFLGGVPTREANLVFKFDRDEFEKRLNFRVFETQRGIYVSAPFGTIGSAEVQLTAAPKPRIRVDDVVVDEKVRARRA
jgi:hypothetical protein